MFNVSQIEPAHYGCKVNIIAQFHSFCKYDLETCIFPYISATLTSERVGVHLHGSFYSLTILVTRERL